MEQIQETKMKITSLAMKEELGDDYKKCWAFAFKYASEEVDFDAQVNKLKKQFDLIRPQAEWFIKGATRILAKKNKAVIEPETEAKQVQSKLLSSSTKKYKPQINYVSQIEMMTFLSDINELQKNSCFKNYWTDQ